MRQDQLEHAIRTACQIIGRHEVIVVGSQSILGTFREDQLPADATRSVEIDILPIADDNSETERLADLIEGVAGEFSPFEELHGFSIDAVDLSTSALQKVSGAHGRFAGAGCQGGAARVLITRSGPMPNCSARPQPLSSQSSWPGACASVSIAKT